MSSSIFDLKTNINELSSSNQGTSRLSYDQISPSRDVTAGNFANGTIFFKLNGISGERWWLPSRSYFKMRVALSRGDGTAFSVADQVAPSMSLFSNLFMNMELRLNDKTISRVSNYVSQVEALEQRIGKSAAQLDGVLGSTNFMQASFEERQAQICYDGVTITDARTKINTPIIGLKDNQAIQLPLLATNTLLYTTLSGIVTFAAGSIPNVSHIFRPNDRITLSGANLGTVLKVISVINATTIQCEKNETAANIGPLALNSADISATIIRDASNSRNVREFEITWTPSSLSVFKLRHALPCGQYSIVLNPFPSSVYQLQAIESKNQTNYLTSLANPSVLGSATAVRFLVNEMYFYCNVVDGPRADNMSYLLDLSQTMCQQESLKSTNFSQKSFDISPSTYAVTVAFQDGRCMSDPRVPSSIFKCYATNYINNYNELALSRLYVSYGGSQKPSPDANPEFKEGVDNTVQRYLDTLIDTGSYFDSSSETIQNYHDRGAYYHWNWPRDGTDRSTRLSVFCGFNDAQMNTAEINGNCLVFSHSKQVCKIVIQDGVVTDVQVEEA